MLPGWRHAAAAVAATSALAVGCAAIGGSSAVAAAPGFVSGQVVVKSYDGATDDLLTAGLGAAGLAGTAPAVTDPGDPAQLRRLAIYNNYRALVDVSPGGGYGTLYGPGVGGPEKVAGKEYLALARDRDGQNVTLLVQIPAAFDVAKPCVVTGPSSGSRGIYGAIGTSGEWGLKKGCAVAYTDKGTGIGAHDLADDVVTRLDGVRGPESSIGRRSNFTAPVSDAQRINFNAQYPNRYAFEHAHSERNPERDWDNHVLRSLDFALWALNEEFPFRPRDPSGPRPTRPRFTFDNTLVIGSSVSNGGGASLRAAEKARRGVIDGVAVSEPNVNPRLDGRIAIVQGADAPFRRHSRPLFDYITLYNLFQGCASAAHPLAANTCQSLQQAGLLTGATFAEQTAEAQRKINDDGILEEQNHAAQTYWATSVYQSVSVTYANAYARASVLDNLCGYSFAATSATAPFGPVPLPDATDALLFSVANGIPPTAGIQLVNNLSVGGPARNDMSTSPTFNRQDQNVSGALCLRALATGYARGDGPTTQRALYREIRESIGQIRADGRLGGIPTVIVHGRSDALLPPNHTSRPYYALSLKADG
ncbi:MAG TPA: 3-hydroxybutyrate oligomer hydrolase family protein, partial [Geminicoccaceae bacterium]